MKVASLFCITLMVIPLAYAEQGPNTDEITFIHYQDESVAVQEVKAGNLDSYFWRIPLEITKDLKNDPNIRIYESPGGRLSLLLNPAESNTTLNPFSIREVRYALNYLIDRELVINEVLRGFGAPLYSAYGQFDPDYTILIDTIESFGFRYNPILAEEIIKNALEKNGANKVNGKWYYNNEPITVKFFIRNDDPRRERIGKILLTELNKLGFNTEEINGDLTKAFDIVYGKDPKSFEWHIYTEGWGASAINRYDDSLVAQMYAPWFANMPGFQNSNYWNYQNQTLDDVTLKIFTGNYTSKSERDQLLNKAIKLGVSESVRIFIASTLDPYIVNNNLEGIIQDFGAGITSRFSLINAKSNDNILKVGMKQIYQGSWNPVAGFRDWYSTRVWSAISDPAIFRYPHTGDILPVRSTWRVETMGPNNKLPIPEDAFIWNATSDKWVNVHGYATSKVVYDLKYSKWHDNSMMDKNDILYSIYFLYEWANKESDNDPTYDSEYAATATQLINTLKGFRFIDDNTIEVYVDYWHFDANYIADYASIWSSIPWQIYAAMEDLVINNKAAFSKSEANIKGVSWLSLLIKDDSNLIKESLTKFKNDKFIPKPLAIDQAYAEERYTNSINWIKDKNHAVISNGPFYLEQYNPDARTITIKAFRDPTYPFEKGYWNNFTDIKLATISNLKVPLSITRGENVTITGSIRYDGNYNDVDIFYFIKDGDGNIITKDSIKPNTDGTINLELLEIDTMRLSKGSNELKIMSISNKAIIPDIRSMSVIAIGDITSKNISVESYKFNIIYNLDGSIDELNIDNDNKILIAKVTPNKDTILSILLPRELIDAKEGDKEIPFTVMVDNTIVNANEESSNNIRMLKIPINTDNKEVKIIGTQVVPEFGVIAILILAISISIITIRRINMF